MALGPWCNHFTIPFGERIGKWYQIIMFAPGELAANRYVGYLTKATITGVYAKEVGGAAIIVERMFMPETLACSIWPRILFDPVIRPLLRRVVRLRKLYDQELAVPDNRPNSG